MTMMTMTSGVTATMTQTMTMPVTAAADTGRQNYTSTTNVTKIEYLRSFMRTVSARLTHLLTSIRHRWRHTTRLFIDILVADAILVDEQSQQVLCRHGVVNKRQSFVLSGHRLRRVDADVVGVTSVPVLRLY